MLLYGLAPNEQLLRLAVNTIPSIKNESKDANFITKNQFLSLFSIDQYQEAIVEFIVKKVKEKKRIQQDT